MKIKIFTSDISPSDLENKISDWCDELNPVLLSVNVTVNNMHDHYVDSAPPMICNEWTVYTASIVYELKHKNNG